MARAAPVDLSAVLPARFTLAGLTHACGATDRTTLPDGYTQTVALSDVQAAAAMNGGDEGDTGGAAPAGFPGDFGVRDTVAAVYSRSAPAGSTAPVAIPAGSAPDNAANLQALALQLAGDFYGWRSVRFDRSYAGIVAIPPDGTIDAITWGHDEWGPWTRVRSAPLGDEPADFNHADPSDCPECIYVYGPDPVAKAVHPEVPTNATAAGGGLRRWKWCLEGTRETFTPDRLDPVPGCCSCTTTITVSFAGLGGGPVTCGGPGTMSYDIKGTAAAGGTAVSLKGTATPACQGTTCTLTLSFTGAQLPEGNYTITLQELGTPCGQPYGPTGRFAGSTKFTVKCPSTTVKMTLPAQFDVLAAASNFRVAYCYLGNDTPWQLAVSASGPGICQTQQLPGGNVGVTLKVTAYPVSVTFSAGGTHILGSTETRTWTNCSTVTSDWNSQPLAWYDQYAINALGCPSCNLGSGNGGPGTPQPVVGQVALSGGLTGTGQTTGLTSDGHGGSLYGYASLSGFVPDKGPVTAAELEISWTVSVPGFADVTYNEVDYQASLGTQNHYPGTLCPAGGLAGALESGEFCLGCPESVASVTVSVLGQTVQLTAETGANGPGAGFVVNMLSLPCSTQVGQYLPPTMGPVQFHIYFICQDKNRPYVSLFYASSDGAPTQCARSQTPVQNQAGWDQVGADSTYATTYSASCDPLMSTEDYSWNVGVPKYDGSGTDTYTEYPIHITISE